MSSFKRMVNIRLITVCVKKTRKKNVLITIKALKIKTNEK